MPRFLEVALRLLDFGLSEIFQTECFGCGRHSAKPVCDRCWFMDPVDFVFGSEVHTVLYYREPWRSVLHAIKFQNHQELLGLFRPFCDQLDLSYLPVGTSVVPVPSHYTSLRKRGFNPPDALGKFLSTAHGLPFHPNCLYKTRRTEIQSTLSDQDRASNPGASYRARGPAKHVLLVDDVVTTGATLKACAEALKAVGCEQVFLWALFRARREKALDNVLPHMVL